MFSQHDLFQMIGAHADHDVVILLQEDPEGVERMYLECDTCDGTILSAVEEGSR